MVYICRFPSPFHPHHHFQSRAFLLVTPLPSPPSTLFFCFLISFPQVFSSLAQTSHPSLTNTPSKLQPLRSPHHEDHPRSPLPHLPVPDLRRRTLTSTAGPYCQAPGRPQTNHPLPLPNGRPTILHQTRSHQPRHVRRQLRPRQRSHPTQPARLPRSRFPRRRARHAEAQPAAVRQLHARGAEELPDELLRRAGEHHPEGGGGAVALGLDIGEQ